jgi:hypothetical protein
MLSRDDDIDVVAAAQAMVEHRQEAIGVRRQIDAHHTCDGSGSANAMGITCD